MPVLSGQDTDFVLEGVDFLSLQLHQLEIEPKVRINEVEFLQIAYQN